MARHDLLVAVDTLPRALHAQFESQDRSCCVEGTRVDLLDQINCWIEDDARPHQRRKLAKEECPDDNSISHHSWPAQRIFWINGSAGTGKTAIACTVADLCRRKGILGASFFCSRDDAECSNPNLIFTTIAYQLALFCPAFHAELVLILESKPDIANSSVPYQLEELITRPLRRLGMSFPRCVVVMDAIDECKDQGTTSIVLSSFSRFVSDLHPLKFLITSRPVPRIASLFRSSRRLLPATQRLVLHDVDLDVVQHDIEIYLANRLQQIRTIYVIEDTWPSRKDIVNLATLSYGLFIFAATAARYIEDQNYSNPKRQLAAILSKAAISSPYRLDHLYSQVLHHAFPDISPHLASRLKLVVGSIILLRDPLSPQSLEHLLGLDTNIVSITLAYLHSVIIVPETRVDLIRLLHPSFYDYITDPGRCTTPNFFVDVESQHTILAVMCLNALCGLQRDICRIQDPTMR